jgi:hypothetical protein
MRINRTRLLTGATRSAVVLTALMAAACAPPYQPPQQVQSSTPTITYKYRSDTDLLQVSQTAANYCRQYQAVAQAGGITNDPDGSKIVVYDCVQPTTIVTIPEPLYAPNMAYSYRTDQDLLNAQRNAQIYCMNHGSQQVTSNVMMGPNGTKTSTFQCTPG